MTHELHGLLQWLEEVFVLAGGEAKGLAEQS